MTARSRARRVELFMNLMKPTASERVLDVGIIDSSWRSSNPLEMTYPFRDRITAVSLHDAPDFREAFPEVAVVVADGRSLPFPDDTFDIGFSNAVVEHVGTRDQQRSFVSELVRTCGRVMIATPNARFPIDPHTLLPFVHWLPRPIRARALRATGNARWVPEASLNPLTASELRSLFPPGIEVRIVRQRVLGLATVLMAIADKRGLRG
jgi:hypothetical protein